MYDNFADSGRHSDDQEIATRVPAGSRFSGRNVRESGSRYEDKRIRDAAGRRSSGRRGRRRKKRNGGIFLLMTVVLAALIICVAAVILQRQAGGTAGRRAETPQENAGGAGAVSEDGGSGKEAPAGEEEPPEIPQKTADASDAENRQEAPAAGNGENSSEGLIDMDVVESPYAVLIDASTGEILAAKRSEEKIFPASMTKMLTVLTAIENIPDLDKTIYMSEDYYKELYAQDASRAGFEPGEAAVIRDLLYGALLPSGAECCIELARQAAGSEDAFVGLMNQKAADLGLVQTHFTNCTGLHNKEQFSTCTEIGRILEAALCNETFFDVFTTHHYSVAPTEIHPDGFTFWSTLFKSTVDEAVTGGEIIGGKTGYTDEAGHCLASAAEIYGRIYILVTAGWPDDPENDLYHVDDAFRAYNELGSALS